MTQNAISNVLKLKTFLGEHVYRHFATGNYQILKFHDPTQDTFSPHTSKGLQTSWLGVQITAGMVEIFFCIQVI